MVALILVVTFTFLFLVFTYSLCKTASDSDRDMERILKMGEYQKAYDEYRRKFAKDNGLTIERATEYQAVKNYKAYLEDEYGAVIKESGCVK